LKIKPDKISDSNSLINKLNTKMNNEKEGNEGNPFKDFMTKTQTPKSNIRKFRNDDEKSEKKKMTVSMFLMKAKSDYIPLNKAIMNGGGLGQLYR
jgi:hypothetical protein